MAGAIKRVRIELDRTVVRSVGMSYASPHVADTTRKTLNRSRILTPVRTGKLRASQQMTMKVRPTYVAGTVQTRVKYAHYVHDGTRPHIIRARRRQYLRFQVGGQVLYRRMVRHPGTKGRPFMRTALFEVAEPAGYRVTGGALGTVIGG